MNLLRNDAEAPSATVMLAHGAMAAMDSPFMETMAGLLAARGLSVVRFEFAYMAGRRNGGKKRPPPRAEKLLEEYTRAVDAVLADVAPAVPLVIGGKSLGGRVASMVAEDLFQRGQIHGLVCLGYPFHPPAKPENLRTDHLGDIACPTLIMQGERDPFGTAAEIAGYALDPRIQFHWVGDGDHDFGPRGRSGYTRKGNLEAAADTLCSFALGLQR